MLSILKPNKANLIGTALLLIANAAGGFISRIGLRLVAGGADTAVGAAANGGRAAAFAGAGGSAGQFGNFGLIGGAANLIILALLFYLVISFVVGRLAEQEAGKPQAQAK